MPVRDPGAAPAPGTPPRTPAGAAPGILTVTLNPALDVTTSVDRMIPDAKLRCDPPRLDPGGGGANVSRALARFGRESLPFVAIGGAFGQAYRPLLEGEGLRPVWFEVSGETRESLAVHDRSVGRQFRFVLPGAPWSEADGEGSLARLEELMEPGQLVVLSGSQPPGVAADYAGRLAAAAARKGARLVLDTSGGALQAAARGGAGAEVLRMDRHEAADLLETEADAVDEAAAADLARDLVARGAARIAVVTIGGAGAVGATRGEVWRVAPPKVEVVSTVGAGDCFVAGLCLGLAEGRAFVDTLALAMAAAASAVTTPATALCDAEQTRALAEEVTRRPL